MQTVWRLCSDPMTSGHLVVSGQRLYQFLLPYTKQRWVTAALILASNDILVCGDRGGTVHTFCLTGQVCQQCHRLKCVSDDHSCCWGSGGVSCGAGGVVIRVIGACSGAKWCCEEVHIWFQVVHVVVLSSII